MKNWQNEIFTGEITGENFGVRMGDSFIVCIDVDDIELLPYFEHLKNETYMVKTGNGFHIYIKVKEIAKIQRLNNEHGQHIDIQSTGSYVMGEGSTHYDKEGNATGKMYELLSKDRKINQIPFEPIKDILENLGFYKYNKSQNYEQRKRFNEDRLPTKGTSNSFYFNAALQCNTDGLSRDEAKEKIKLNYDRWVNSPDFSNRDWSNIEVAINKVYDE
ncbi:MAG: hypothetical protein HOL90_06590, partial [Candidatus Nitrosopelagicus sp.]|nr:hypothetical protein [Candidatus Nitrosopelagicus sp.]